MADSSPNPYIRTYAKDMASFSKKETEAPALKTGAEEKSTEAAPAEERHAVLARLRSRAAKEPAHENTMLPSSLPVPQPKVASTGSDSFARPTPLPASVIPLKPPVTAAPPAPVQISEPIVVPPPPSLIPLPASPPAQKPPEPMSPIPQLLPKEGPSPIHTYKSDFADRIDTKGASAFSVLAAQVDEKRIAPRRIRDTSKVRRGILITIAGVVLIVGGGVGVFAAYRYVSMHSVVSVGPSVPSLIFADDRQALTGEGQELLHALATSSDSPLPEGQVRVLYLTQSSTTPNNTVVMIPLAGGKLFGALQLSAPDILLRNIATESTVGIVHAGEQTKPFFILKVLSYERTFAGMLQWEIRIQSDLAILYPLYPLPAAPPPTIATTTKKVNGKVVVATTTVEVPPVVEQPPRFVDEVASNHDVRALKDSHGRTIMLYGYKDKETLIIARDEAAFAELLNRLAATKQQ